MNRLFTRFALGLVLIAGGFPALARSTTVTDLSPQIINRIILIAGDVIDLQWDPASYPLYSGETFLRWELFGQTTNPPSTRLKSGEDKTTGYYRHSGLNANQQYFYRLEVVNCVAPCATVADERRHTVFSDSAHTNRLEGWVIKTLSMKPMEVQVGTGEVDYNLTIQDGATFNIGSGAKLNKGSSLPKILVRNSTLNIDGAEINGVSTINFGSYDPADWGAGKVVNTKFAVVPSDQDPTYIRLYGDREVLLQTNTGQLNIYGYGAKNIRIEDNILENSTIDFSGSSQLEMIGNELLQLDIPLNDRMVWLRDGVQATLTGNRFWYTPDEYGGVTLLYGSGDTTELTVRSNEFTNARVTFNEGVQVDFSDNLVQGSFSHVNVGPDYMDCPGNLQATGKIERNTIQNGNGIDIIGPASLSIKQNCIRGNGYGLDYGSSCNTVTQDATANWWGHASGPWHVSQNPGGLGDKISGALVSLNLS